MAVHPRSLTCGLLLAFMLNVCCATESRLAANENRMRGATGNLLAGPDTGRVFFLFLTEKGIDRPELWQAFFKDQYADRYRVLLHCKWHGMCAGNLKSAKSFGLTLVDTVPTDYCTNLVGAMVKLLEVATRESTSAKDRFVFLSDSTLPVKPFSVVFDTLVNDPDSDFCIKSTGYVAQGAAGQHVLLPKHSQWVALSKEHADIMVQRWPEVSSRGAAGIASQPWKVPLRSEGGKATGKFTAITTPSGSLRCTDEWAFFATINGVVVADQKRKEDPVAMQLLDGKRTDSSESTCRTFAVWNEHAKLTQELKRDFPYSKLDCLPACKDTHPAEFQALSDHGAELLRKSSYLFARKFDKGVMELKQFQEIILQNAK